MKLQDPNSGIRWKDYQISTPTFDLSSIEKPDFSPFLVHMTGKNQLLSILKGENAPDDVIVNKGQGFLKASIPVYDGSNEYYNANVVCFTESPLFALDFFRYRSFNRWKLDQQFGIGFSKTDLVVRRNVRPVIYLDSQSNRDLLNLCNNIIDDNIKVTDNNGKIQDFKLLAKKLKPLLFPLLEDKPSQGFMWEREWRCPNSDGMTFPLNAIKIICCPADEKEEISELLKDHSDNIQIVESWKEYDDVTSYLKRRDKETKIPKKENINRIEDIKILNNLKEQNDQTFHSLSAYYGVFRGTVDQLEERSISDILKDLKETSKMIVDQIENLKKNNR